MRIFLILFVLLLGSIPTYFAFETPVVLSKEVNLSLNLSSEYVVKYLGARQMENSIARHFVINSTKDPKKNATFSILSFFTPLGEVDPREFTDFMEDYFVGLMAFGAAKEISNVSINDVEGRKVIIHTFLHPRRGNKWDGGAWIELIISL